MLPAGCVSTHTVFCLRTPLPLGRPAFPVRAVQQPGRQLPRAAAGHHTRDDGDRGAVAGSAPIRRGRSWLASRRLARLLVTIVRDASAFAELNVRVAALYQLSEDDFAHVLGTFPLVAREERDAIFRRFRRRRHLNARIEAQRIHCVPRR